MSDLVIILCMYNIVLSLLRQIVKNKISLSYFSLLLFLGDLGGNMMEVGLG